MSIDLGAILDGVQPVIDSAVETIGSEWTIWRNPRGTQDRVTDRVTGKVVDADPEQAIATGLPGIWAPDTGAGAQQFAGVNLPGAAETGSLVLMSDVVDVLERDVVECTLSRDERLVGRRFVVRKVPDGSAGVVRLLRCEAENKAAR